MTENAEIPVKVNIDAETINSAVIRHLMESELGKAIKESIERAFGKAEGFGYHHNIKDWIDNAVKQQVAIAIRDVLEEEEYQNKIKKVIREKLTDAALNETARKAIDYWMSKG